MVRPMSERSDTLLRLMADDLCSLYLLRRGSEIVQNGMTQVSKWKRWGLAGMMDVDCVRDGGLYVLGLEATHGLVVEGLRAM